MKRNISLQPQRFRPHRLQAKFSAVLAAIVLSICSASALAEIDTFRLNHRGGPCDDAHFDTGQLLWANRHRITIVTNETIGVTLYGFGAEYANGASGADIFEWVDAKGTTVNYPNAVIVAGQKIPKGYATVAIRAESQHGLGNRTVTVHWPTGSETIPIRVVASCQDLAGVAYRTTVAPGTVSARPLDRQLTICIPSATQVCP